MSALAVGDINIYKDVSLTQRASTSGFALLDTDGIDVDTFTGVNAISIDLADNTTAGFYAVGSFYTVILGPITIDTQTVYTVLATFRIVAAEAVAGKPKVDVDAWLGTAAAAPTVAGVPEVDLTHVAGATTNVAALATNVDAILTDTGTTLDGRIPAALVSGRIDASVGAMAGAVVTAAAIATDAIDADALAADAVTEIWAKAMSDLAAVPGATDSVLAAINWLFELARNKVTQSSTTQTLKKDDAATTLATAAVSDDGSAFTRGEWT
jgi:hypothetical protein